MSAGSYIIRSPSRPVKKLIANLASEVNGLGADMIPTAVRRFENIAEMQAATGLTNGQRISVSGYHSTAADLRPDGGGGEFVYRAASAASADGGLVIAATGMGAGRLHRVVRDAVSALWFGARPDSDVSGVGTDNVAAFGAWMAAVAAGVYERFVIPPGRYACSGVIQAGSAAMRRVVIDAAGAEIIITGAPALSQRYFQVFAVGQVGESLTVRGLTMRHNRPTSRQAGTDMISVSGFRHYVLENLRVGSADNMGIVVGRNDPAGFVPESLTMIAPRVGGHYEATPHLYAPIGDTGIWVVAAPKVTHIVAPYVEGTGDDGLLVGHSTAATSGQTFITDAEVRDAGGNGIVVSVPNGRITGRVDRTNQAGVALIPLDGSRGGKMTVDVDIQRPGQLLAGDVGTNMLAKLNPWGVWIWQGGAGSGEISLDGTRIRDSYSAAINIQPTGGLLSAISGKVFCSRIGEQLGGGINANGAILRRSSTGGDAALSKVALEVEVRDCRVPLIAWNNSGTADDEKNDIKFRVFDSTVDASFASQAMLNFETVGARAGRIKTTTVKVEGHRCTWPGTLLRCQGGNSAKDVWALIADEYGEYNVRNDRAWIGNSNAARRFKARPIIAKRSIRWDGSTASLLAELDPTVAWLVECFENDPTDHSAYLKGFYEPSSRTVTVVTSMNGGNSTAFALVYNAANTAQFPTGTLEVRAASSGFSNGAFLDGIMIATPVADAGSVATG